ncbi:type VI secretion system membrane subunit TssM [Limobrevibacterium gyesilva]|uniref:Type VI secretion system membrane subunit TssM n=1 Tax=Limobrevibacterium gyesilva TaxID=2991712 RepID=A0AA41YJU3_9PROT|nr:type VI secretion system membrane subunit TssM [Limobrevibacterium gyesilva]MCW3473910.1 type VI secretion system membrane subunit TssM [Limobrevibacterium gyesilva]
MKAVIGFFASRWFLTFIGVALLAVLVWYFGPLLDALESWIVRLAIILAMLLVWFGVNLWLHLRRSKRETALERGVAEASQDPSAAASAEEVAALGDKLTRALALLKKARGTSGWLYEQPWYVIIGPPGAGKTTALLNAGLKFPLAAEMGQAAVAGVGGTRMCEWWFTEDAVLIDTAGRYTTRDSDEAVDRAGWEGFLDLLKRTRERQPLNGVLVAIALSDIAQAPQSERLAHARAIRKRIKELSERLGVRVPVYALLTKADLLAGFTEFFDDLDREKRAQVWGTTFPLSQGEAGPVAAFTAEFRLLIERLNTRLLDRLQAERSPERRAMIAGFPAQVASLEQPLAEFLQEAFGGSRLDPAPFLRGVYMTSGTQEGTPIDRLTGALARAFGVDQRRAPSLRPEQGRSYFLGRLLKDVVFGEAMLVSAPPAARRRRVLMRSGAFALLALATLGIGGALWHSRSANEAAIAEADKAITAYTQTASSLPLDPVRDAELPPIVPLLDQARDLPFGAARQAQDNARTGGLGLSQADKLSAGSRLVYRHALERVLLPRLVLRLEAQMRGALNRPDFLYEATRVYLMLGGAGPLDKDLVRAWMALDWQRSYPGAPATPLRDDLAQHLGALLAEPLPAVSLDGALVEDARRVLSRVPLAQRVYARISQSSAAQRIPPWRPGDAAGTSGARVFVRGSGKPLTDPIPGFYTVEGFHRVLLPALANVAKEVAAESWVLGTRTELDPAGPQLRGLERDVIGLYTKDYAAQWDALLDDLNIKPSGSIAQAVQDLYILSSPQSPMRDLLGGIAKQLTLSVPPPPPPGAQGAAQAAAAAATAAAQAATSSAAQRLQSLVGGADAGPPPPPPGKEIDDRYQAVRDFLGSGPGAPIDNVLKLMNDLQQQLQKMASAASGGAPPVGTGEDPAQLLLAEAGRQPMPVARWLRTIAVAGTALRGGGAKQQAAAAFNGSGGPAQLCKQAVDGRYPFRAGAQNEIPMGDFSRLFAPGGLLDGFFNTQLRPYVDMAPRTWVAKAVDGVPAPISQGDLAQFQRAAVIRDLFFASGGTAPSVRFDITPVRLDNGARQVTLDMDGVTVSYANGPTRSTQITWPGPNGMNNVRLVFDPPPTGSAPVLQASGPWALFRLFGQGTLRPGPSPERFTLAFKQGEREAEFDIRVGSVFNPFIPGMLQDFRCPNL